MIDGWKVRGCNSRCIPIEQERKVLINGVVTAISEMLFRIADDIDDGMADGLRSVEFDHRIEMWDLQLIARCVYERAGMVTEW